MTEIAVVGAGNMGAAMVARLREVGHAVTVYNRTAARAASLAARTGALAARTAREAAEQASHVIVSLADDAAVLATYRGDDGLAAGLQKHAIVLETSTIHPSTVRRLASDVESRGATLLDTPVSGSVPVVQRGELLVMAGGPSAAVARAEPVFGALAKRVIHVGGQGSGATMKLAVNAVVHALNLALSEALVLAERAGVDRALAYEVFASSAVAAPFVQYKRPAFLAPDGTPVAFSLDLVAKDLDLIDTLAHDVGARMDQLATTRDVVARALAAGLGEHDLSALAGLLREPN
ncbi:NAD(P)-dependent oxidoreductase [Allorhizocola rhizosphaerae]|uniref:NAD(P)-dependent oxidoreductase n=1 Tax=Allorhizocola rhizosphaerae TaxID=1872709 RepID=UPI001B8AFAE9|nr:NAD(P)-dependent oxidoreductase [Allorhizocola rhizosphaerae]